MKKRVLLIMLSLMVVSTYLVGCDDKSMPGEKTSVTKEKVEEISKTSANEVSFDWSENELVKNIPLPNTDKTSIEVNDEENFWVYIDGDKDDFNAYIRECKKAGFNIDISELDEKTYSAYNKDGIYMSLVLEGTQYKLTVKASMVNESMAWPTTGMATLIPKPESAVGNIIVETEDHLNVCVGDTTKEQFNAYIEECINNGFNYDYQKNDDLFIGRNVTGDHLQIGYEGVNTMHIFVTSMKQLNDGWTPEGK